MLIQATNHTKNVGYEARLVQKYGKDTPAFEQVAATVDRVTISDTGRAMNQAVSDAIDPAHDLWAKPSADGTLPKAVMITNYADARQRAEDGLKEAMHQLDIPLGTKVSLTFNSDGTISLEGGGNKNAELEAMVNENRDLRNILVAASGTASMERSFAAAEQARIAAESNPGRREQVYAWLIGVTQGINGMGFQFDFSGGSLTGSFLSGEQKIGLAENMEKLPM